MWTVRRPQCSGAEREALLREKFRCFARQVIAHLDAAQDAGLARGRGGHDLARDLAVLPPTCREPERKRGSLLHRSTTNPASAASTGTQSAGQRCPGMGEKQRPAHSRPPPAATAARRAAFASASAFEFAHRGLRDALENFGKYRPRRLVMQAGARREHKAVGTDIGAASATSSGRT